MKVKLQSSSKLCLVKAVKELTNLCLKKAKNLVDEQVKVFGCPPNAKWCIVIDSEKTEEQIEAIAKECNATYTLIDVCEQKQQAEKKLQEVTDDDLGVSIHSIDEVSIGWQCKMLFTNKQAARVFPSLYDAKFNVTEKLVMHEGDRVTMLVITKIFPSGTKSVDIKKFEYLLRRFTYYVCEVINAEERLETAKETATEAFDKLQDYE